MARGLPLIGSLFEFLRRPFHFFDTARERYGDIYTMDLGFMRWVILNHPRHASHVLVEHSQSYGKGGSMWDTVRTLLGNGLVVSEGSFWLRQRRMMQPHFHRKQLAGLTAAMVSATHDSMDEWQAAAARRQPIELMAAFPRMTMRVILRALFGQGLSPSDMEQASSALAYALGYVMVGTLTYSLPKWVPIPGARRYRESLATSDAIVGKLIQSERNAQAPTDSLLGMLIQMVDQENGDRMTDKQLRDEVITLFLAGYETTSVALSWAMYLLSQHPEVMARLRSEVDAALGGRLPTFADLGALTYCRMVVQETLRVRSPSWFVPRTALVDDVIDGYRIPAGTEVVVLTHGIHHNPKVWEQPERFDPERFRSDQPSARERTSWMPFGLGQRQCIGKEFALIEAQLILAMLVQRYDFSIAASRPVQPKLALTLRPDSPILMKLEPRAAAQ